MTINSTTEVVANATQGTSMGFTALGLSYSIIIILAIFLFLIVPYLYELAQAYGITKERNKNISSLINKIQIGSEVDVDTSKGFHFDGPDIETHVAHNIMEFSLLLNSLSDDILKPFFTGKKFSPWIKDTLKIDSLASDIEKIETTGNLDELKKTVKNWVNEHEPSYSLITSIIDLMKQPVEGISGFTRGMIAIGIIFILGIAIVMILIAENGDRQLVSSVMSMMGTTLAAVVGFYFGGKSSEGSK